MENYSKLEKNFLMIMSPTAAKESNRKEELDRQCADISISSYSSSNKISPCFSHFCRSVKLYNSSLILFFLSLLISFVVEGTI
jgi:hypothetical protein